MTLCTGEDQACRIECPPVPWTEREREAERGGGRERGREGGREGERERGREREKLVVHSSVCVRTKTQYKDAVVTVCEDSGERERQRETEGDRER